jgi:DNA polymerase-3 subunit alpha/DNA polymerase-3 subunit epsilon
MKKILFFDTETTGLPKYYKKSYTDSENWPRLVQLSWIVYHDELKMSSGNHLIKPHGFTIPKEASNIHGHSHDKCMNQGRYIFDVLGEFYGEYKTVDTIVGHNVSFDRNIISSELHRMNKDAAVFFREKPKACTMFSSIDYCKLPGSFGYKWPKLEELYKVLFNKEMENAHNALHDVNATAECYFELVKRGVIS